MEAMKAKESRIDILKSEYLRKDFFDYESLNEFLSYVDKESDWETIDAYDASMVKVSPGEIIDMTGFIDCDEYDIEDLEEKGGWYLKTDWGNFIFSKFECTTSLLNQKMGLTCSGVSTIMDHDRWDLYLDLLNELFRTYKNTGMKILVRSGQVVAIHSDHYQERSQKREFEIVNNYLRQNRAIFDRGSFSNTLTKARWHIEDDDLSMKKLKEVFRNNGFPALAEGTDVTVRFQTSDIGTSQSEISPSIEGENVWFPLGEPIKVKHNGDKTEEELENSVRETFAVIEEGVENIKRLSRQRILNPAAAFVAACKHVGLHRIIPGATKKALEEFKSELYFLDEIKALDIYVAILELKNSTEKMIDETQVKVKVALSRLSLCDWEKFDIAGGKEEF